MTILVEPGRMREIAESFARYFEARRLPLRVASASGMTLEFVFGDELPSAVTVSFDDAALHRVSSGNDEARRAELDRMYSAFVQALERDGGRLARQGGNISFAQPGA
jgi:hypothetical protein